MSKISRMASIPPLDRPLTVKVKKAPLPKDLSLSHERVQDKGQKNNDDDRPQAAKRKRGGIPERKMASAIYKAARP
jgi:hypothetical protein